MDVGQKIAKEDFYKQSDNCFRENVMVNLMIFRYFFSCDIILTLELLFAFPVSKSDVAGRDDWIQKSSFSLPLPFFFKYNYRTQQKYLGLLKSMIDAAKWENVQ